MIPRRVVLKNFLSFGDDEQTFDFTDDEALWALTGPNGVGKSAVFDAITYCLFGQHRGGKDGAGNLIRHGANSFRVSFEFSLNGVDYLITRTRGFNTTQRVEKWDEAAQAWIAVAGVNSVAEVDNWVKSALGIRFEAFTASVLLRQGEADAIVEATGKVRLEILKKIIDVERFEKLSYQIGDAAKKCRVQLDGLCERRDGLSEVTESDVESAKMTFAQAELNRTVALDAKQAASQRVDDAKQRQKLEAELRDLDGKLREADDRANKSREIEKAHERFVDLRAVLPPLRQIAAARTRIAASTTKQSEQSGRLDKVKEDLEAAAAALKTALDKAGQHAQAKSDNDNEAKRLGKEIDYERNFLTTAERVAALTTSLAGFALDLDGKLTDAEDREQSADEAQKLASTARTTADTRLTQLKMELKEFETVGATCSKCRQPVSATHAAEERAALARDIADFTEQMHTADREWQTANQAQRAAAADVKKLRLEIPKRNAAANELISQRSILETFGLDSDPVKLRKQIEEKNEAKSAHEERAATEQELAVSASNDAARLEQRRNELIGEKDSLTSALQKIDNSLAEYRGEFAGLLGSLPSAWRSRAEVATVQDVEALADEQAELERGNVAREFAALQSDSSSQIVWKAQREQAKTSLAGLPLITVAEADALDSAATKAVGHADNARDEAKTALDGLARAAQDFRALLASIAVAEQLHERHRKLNDWLGKDGLLRELVRDAERDIVRFAQDTLRNLSSGDLEIELQSASDGRDEALALLVRRSSHPNPIPVKFLSGSQKFRVAVAIAVAIGKFASGPSSARPLESVIIDEGFGSLDKDGLQAMREELENLKQAQALKRIILVSHQDGFTSTFPVGYRLAPGENGTIATRFRHSGIG